MGVPLTIRGRASFLNAFTPRGNEQRGFPPRFSVTVILPIGFDFAPVQAAIEGAIAEKYGANIPAGLTMPWKMGDPANAAENGHILLKCYSPPDQPPQVWDQANQVIIDQSKIYSGCEVSVHVNVYAHNNNGVSCFFKAIRLEADGEHLDSQITAESAFGAAPAAAAAVPGAAPVYGGAPAPAVPGAAPMAPAAPVATAPAAPVAPVPNAAPVAPAQPAAGVVPTAPGAVAQPVAAPPSEVAPAVPVAAPLDPMTGKPYLV